MKTNRLFLLPVIIIFLQPILTYSRQHDDATPDSYEMIETSVNNAAEHILLKRESVSYREFYTEEELDRNGGFKSYKIFRRQRYHGRAYSATWALEGDNQFDINFSGLMREAYDYSILNPEEPTHIALLHEYKVYEYLSVCDCHILRVQPKTTQPPIEKIAPTGSGRIQTGIHETATRMSGITFINKEYLFVRRFTARLDNAYSPLSGWGLVQATMGTIDAEFELMEFNLDSKVIKLIVVKHFETMYQAKKLGGWLGNETRRKIHEFDCYFLNAQPIPIGCQPPTN